MTPTELEKLADEYTKWEKTLGTNKVSTGAFAYEMDQIVEAIAAGGGTPTGPTEVTFADSVNLDAFGRLRVSTPFTLFDGKTLRTAQNNAWDDVEAAGTGTGSTFSANRASDTLSVSAATAGTRVRQTLQRFPYAPGKSQLALVTFVHGVLAAGISRKIGLFDNQNGIFLDTEGTAVGITRRSFVTGSAVDTTVQQANWNIDTFDGNGPSGVTLDLTKAQILVIDYEWLGVGRVRVGFNVDGVTYPAHQFLNANNLTSVYMSSPNLPIRYEIENSGAGAAAELEAICSAVLSEGGQDPIGTPYGVANAGIVTGINGTGANRYALLGLRVASVHASSGVISPVRFSMIGSTNNDVFAWEIVLDATVAGTPTWVSGGSGSISEYFDGTSANTVTGGEILGSGVGFSQTEIQIDTRNIRGPGVQYDGTPQELTLVIRPYSNMAAVAGLSWVER